MARGVIPLPLSALKEMLMLPEDYKMLTAYYAHQPELVCLVVEHPDIPEREEKMAKVIPAYVQYFHEDGTRTASVKDIHFI